MGWLQIAACTATAAQLLLLLSRGLGHQLAFLEEEALVIGLARKNGGKRFAGRQW